MTLVRYRLLGSWRFAYLATWPIAPRSGVTRPSSDVKQNILCNIPKAYAYGMLHRYFLSYIPVEPHISPRNLCKAENDKSIVTTRLQAASYVVEVRDTPPRRPQPSTATVYKIIIRYNVRSERVNSPRRTRHGTRVASPTDMQLTIICL